MDLFNQANRRFPTPITTAFVWELVFDPNSNGFFFNVATVSHTEDPPAAAIPATSAAAANFGVDMTLLVEQLRLTPDERARKLESATVAMEQVRGIARKTALMQFNAASQTLSDASVEFVVIDGLAATFHGSATLTYDLDLCYSRSTANLRRLAAALAPYHPRPRGLPANLPFVWDERTLRNATLLTLQTDLGEIDLLAEVAGLGDFSEVKKRSITIQVFGREIAALELSALIQAKRAAGRGKDLASLPEFESLLEAEDP